MKSIIKRQIRFVCPHCGKINRAPEDAVGRRGVCARCDGGIEVPALASSANKGPSAGTVPIGAAISNLEIAPPIDFEAGEGGGTTAEFIDGFSLPAPPVAVRTLEDLRNYAASRSRSPGNTKFQKTPLWISALHLALPIATCSLLVYLYQNASATKVVVPPHPPTIPPISTTEPTTELVDLPDWPTLPPLKAGQWFEFEIVVQEDDSLSFDVRVCEPVGTDAKSYVTLHYTQMPAGFPLDAPVRFPKHDADETGSSGSAVATITTHNPVGTPMQRAFESIRKGDYSTALEAISKDNSSDASAVRALITYRSRGGFDAAKRAIETVLAATPEHRRVPVLCAASIYTDTDAARAAELIARYLNAESAWNDDAAYQELGIAMERLAVLDERHRPSDFERLRTTLLHAGRSISRTQDGKQLARFGNAWLPAQEASDDWSNLVATRDEIDQAAKKWHAQREVAEHLYWLLAHAKRAGDTRDLQMLKNKIDQATKTLDELNESYKSGIDKLSHLPQPRFPDSAIVPDIS